MGGAGCRDQAAGVAPNHADQDGRRSRRLLVHPRLRGVPLLLCPAAAPSPGLRPLRPGPERPAGRSGARPPPRPRLAAVLGRLRRAQSSALGRPPPHASLRRQVCRPLSRRCRFRGVFSADTEDIPRCPSPYPTAHSGNRSAGERVWRKDRAGSGRPDPSSCPSRGGTPGPRGAARVTGDPCGATGFTAGGRPMRRGGR